MTNAFTELPDCPGHSSIHCHIVHLAGIGLSGHKNAYPPVVAINNFLEDRAAAGDSKLYAFCKPEPAISTYQAVHNRTPAQVAAALGNSTAKITPKILKQVLAPPCTLVESVLL